MLTSNELLERLKNDGIIVPLDFHLAQLFIAKSNLQDPLHRNRFAFLVAWMSVEIRSGHVCINLADLTLPNLEYRLGHELTNLLYHQLDNPTLANWIELCRHVDGEIIGDNHTITPFIRHGNRLYFQRMWLYEKRVAEYFGQTPQLYLPNKKFLQNLLTDLFPTSQIDSEIDWQKVAVISALTRKIAIISGGPGTGKTTTISKILAALVAINALDTDNKKLRIMATAPTGKAAARLTESLSLAIETLTVSQSIKDSLPIEAITLHRLLGARANSNHFLYNKNNLLNIDVLLIDEASMVDLSMMANVIEALPKHCRMILLGDKEQLSSVEAGAVFGDLCELIHQGYSQSHVEMINELSNYQLIAQHSQPSIADSICLLQKSYRFNSQSGIGTLANLIKMGQCNDVRMLFEQGTYEDIVFNSLTNHQEYLQAIENSLKGYQFYLEAIKKQPNNIEYILSCFSRYRLLCALREGRFGVQGLNRIIEQLLSKQGMIERHKQDLWYIGRPIMILRNNFSLGLFNGDIGITLPAIKGKDQLRVYFIMPNGEIKGFSPYRLPEHETAYAMTIHKSQGSEFEHINIILPNEYSPLLNRSLLYTAVTRAKKHVAIYAETKIFERIIKSQIRRESGLIQQIKDYSHQ